ncbi:MAG: hypothetical protein WC365_00465 [Candidatus Babeliales bacterium]|jgi:hypothetical protein
MSEVNELNKEITVNGPALVTIETLKSTEELSNQEIDKEIAQIDSQLAVMEKEEVPQKQSIEADKVPFSARKVAIVGFAESSLRLAPWDDPTWEIWGLNGLHKIIKWTDHITRWFQIHPKESVFGEGKGGGADHVKFLQGLKIPVYMTQHYDEIPTSVAYPLKEICEWFSIGREKEKHPNLSNSISEMLALLAYEIVVCGREVDEIGVWGVDMAHSSEYSYQKSSAEFYLGIFEGYRQVMEIFKRCGFVAGLMKDGLFSPVKLPFPTKWTLPKESLLLQNQFIYGFEEQEENADYLRMQARKNHLAQQRNTNLIKEQEHHDAQMQFLGAMQENESEIKNRGY